MSDHSRVEARARELALKGDSSGAAAEYERLLEVIAEQRDDRQEAEIRRAFATLLHDLGDPRETQQLTKAAALLQRRSDLAGLVDVCLRLCDLHRESRAAALYWADRALTAARKSANPDLLQLALGVHGELLLAFDRPDEGLRMLEEAVALPGGQAQVAALAGANIRSGRVNEGLAVLSRLLAEADSGKGDDAATSRISLRIHLADANRTLGRRAEALRLLRQAEAEAREEPGFETFALVLDRLGSALLEAGEPLEAVHALEGGIEWVRDRRAGNAGELTSLYCNLGNVLLTIGNLDGARRSFSEAVRFARDSNGLRSEAHARFGLGNVLAKDGEDVGARHAYEEARSLADRLEDRSMAAACLDSLGQLASKAHEPARAVDLHQRAARLFASIPDPERHEIASLNLTGALLLLNETAAARRSLDEASAIEGRDGTRMRWQRALLEGQVLAQEGRWDAAREAFRTSIACLEQERAHFETPDDQRLWAAGRVEAFEIATTAAFEAVDALAALGFLEGNRARFLEAVSEWRRRLPRELSDADRRAYAAATRELSDLRWLSRSRPDIVDPGLERRLEKAEWHWRALDGKVEGLRANEEPPPVTPVDVEELASCLAPGETAVALHVSENWTGAACIGRAPDGSLWWRCATDRGWTLDDLSRMVVGVASRGIPIVGRSWKDLQGPDDEDDEQLVAGTCERIGAVIWPLILEILDERTDSLVLIPGRGLNVLPLHAAPTPDGRRALDRWSIRYAPSLKLLAGATIGAAPPAGRVLGQVVNPTQDLPFACVEADAIREVWDGSVHQPLHGPKGTPSRVLLLLEQVDTLHYAGHGAFDPAAPLQSRLQGAPDGSSGAITLRQILEDVQTPRTRVVLLSACETGRVAAGDPLNDQLGLPGGLLTAGVKTVLATFWSVDDFATCLLLSRCVRNWMEPGTTLERALAGAQRWLREEVTTQVARSWLHEHAGNSDGDRLEVRSLLDDLLLRDDEELLFQHELDWAAFHVTGCSVRAT